MRRNIRSAVHDFIEQVGKDLGPVRKAQVAAVETWDNDEWTFGQVLSMSLWFPALLEMFYSMITGDERALTGTLPRPWKATMVSPNETVIEIDNNDPIEPNVRLTIIEPETKQPEVRPELAASA
ncbi:hypothetical protein BZA77DRAFT_313244 [Pyronema omphalodes]|nr:hypothetical protein BZA77DRAFT_313244 [Pyronema omphalodes]